MAELPPPAPSRRPEMYGCGIGVLLGVMLSVLVLGALVWVYSSAGIMQALRSTLWGSQTRILVGQPTVVRQIQQLQRLETVVFTLEKIMIGERENPVLPRFLAGERMLLVVHGQVIAGLDLGKVRPEDVTVKDRTVRVRLPKAEILVTRVDNEKTQVFSRDTGLFASVDPKFETEVRREGERQLRAAATANHILTIADTNARVTITSLLKGLGFERVEVI